MSFDDVDAAIEALNAKDPDQRKAAADALGADGSAEAVAALAAALDADRMDIRINVAEALGKTNHVEAVRPLLEQLEETDLFDHHKLIYL